MKVKTLTQINTPEASYRAGLVVDVDDATGTAWIGKGIATTPETDPTQSVALEANKGEVKGNP